MVLGIVDPTIAVVVETVAAGPVLGGVVGRVAAQVLAVIDAAVAMIRRAVEAEPVL